MLLCSFYGINRLSYIEFVGSLRVKYVDKVHATKLKNPGITAEVLKLWCGAGSNRRHKDFQSLKEWRHMVQYVLILLTININ